MEPKVSLPCSKSPPVPRPCVTLLNNVFFYGDELAPRPNLKLEDHPLLAVRDFWFSVFAATLHPQPEDAPVRDDRDPHNTLSSITRVYPKVPGLDA
jgi:hypothetical protein